MKAALREQPQEFQKPNAKEDESESAKLAQPVRSKQKATGSNATKKAVTTKSSKKGKLSAPPVDQSLDIRPSDKTPLPDFCGRKTAQEHAESVDGNHLLAKAPRKL